MLTGVEAGYGTVRVLHGVTLEGLGGEVVMPLGMNGNGKTPFIRTIFGLMATSSLRSRASARGGTAPSSGRRT